MTVICYECEGGGGCSDPEKAHGALMASRFCGHQWVLREGYYCKRIGGNIHREVLRETTKSQESMNLRRSLPDPSTPRSV